MSGPPMLPPCPFCNEPLASIPGAPCAGCARTLDRLETSREDRVRVRRELAGVSLEAMRHVWSPRPGGP